VTYLVTLDGRRIAFSGDLILADGKVPDLYSFQDAIPEAKIGGYHGYAGRLADLVTSLGRLRGEKPDLLVPARGSVIRQPQAAIDALVSRVCLLYSNYLSTDALRWYFGDAHVLAKARRVLGPEARIDWMQMGETNALPDWALAIDNTRLIRSASGAGLLVDCGGTQILNRLKELRSAGSLKSIDYVFISHYHDDHTDQVPALVREFNSTVLACHEMWDVLENPGAYAVPCLTTHPICVTGRLLEGARWRWNEFEITAWFFPGQTLYHQALLVTKDQGESICFVGDSFTPSGMDDYCLQNRNLVRPGAGFFSCLARLKALPPGCWLVNQHVTPMFRFTRAQVDRMSSALEARAELLEQLLPWDDVNYGLDANWARLHPYGMQSSRGQTNTCRAIILNHSPKEQDFTIRPNLPAGWRLVEPLPHRAKTPPRQEGVVEFAFVPAGDARPGLYVITADVLGQSVEFREWVEALVRVQP
jgi:glyoxylase-like metal-dependent hydrolase (beta-lactamase superfamily II)